MSRAPGVLRCMVALLLCDVALRVLGYQRTMRIARRVAGERSLPLGRPIVERTLQNILVATAFYPGRSKCLEQSVAGLILLRRRGVPVEMRLGVQPYPFSAHAWLELDGVPVTESPEVVANYALLPEAV
jgi:hypothetical protein